MIAVLAIGAFALVVGAGPAFATHEGGELILQLQDTMVDTSTTYFGTLDALNTIKIGDKYYLMTGARGTDRGFQVIEITDPTNIHAEGHVNGTSIGRNILDVNFHQIDTKTYALIASQRDSRIHMIDVTDPSNPTRVSTTPIPGSCGGYGFEPRNAAAVQVGDHHYAMATSQTCDRLAWLNITNPANVTVVATVNDGSYVGAIINGERVSTSTWTDLDDAGDIFFRQLGSKLYAYIIGSSGVQVVDITNASSINVAGREGGFGNEPHSFVHYQVGSKDYMIASVASNDSPEIRIHNITHAPVYPHPHPQDSPNHWVATVRLTANLQGFDIFEMEGRTYLAVAASTDRSTSGEVTFIDITDPKRPLKVAEVRDGVHGFNLLGAARDVSAIKIDGQQYVAVGGDQGISMIHVRPFPYGKIPDISVTASGSLSTTTDDNGNTDTVTLHSGTDSLRLTMSLRYAPAANTQVDVIMKVANYTRGHQTASSAFNQTFIFYDTDWSTPQMVLIPGLNNDWDREYLLILLYTNSTQLQFVGRPVAGIYVTGASQSSPSTQEEGTLRLPTALTLSLGRASVGEDTGTVDITATLDAPAPPEGVSVSLYSSGGTATEGADYTLPASINIAAGERSGSASITIADDTVAESDESAVISTYVDIFGQEMTDSVTLTITDNDGTTVADQDNQPPTVSSAISDVIIPHETGTRTISLSGVFSDADNDSLNVTATSSDATKAAVSVSSDYTSLILTGKARGTATVTVTANDGNGGTISDTFTVQIKAAPTVSSAISDISGMGIGDSRDISLASVFGDADSDPLNVTASTSDYNIAEAIIFQNTLTIIAVSNGSATITLTAQDTDGNRATDTFEVTVAAAQQQNRAPTISSAISDVIIPHETGTRTISLSGVFSDADNDSLNVTATSSDATKAAVSVSSDYTSLILTGKARGTATVTVTANDGNGGTISDIFTVQIKAAPTVSSAISDVSDLVVGDSRDISLDGVFDDADGDSLVITVESSNGSVATVEAASDGSALTITAQAPGTATITVTAQDTDGNQATDTFEVAVAAAQQQTTSASELEPIVAQYDTDGSGAIEQDEWEVAVQDHANGKLTNEEIFAISKARSYN